MRLSHRKNDVHATWLRTKGQGAPGGEGVGEEGDNLKKDYGGRGEGTNMLMSDAPPAHPTIALMNPRFNHPPGWMNHSDYAHFLLSSSSGSTGTTLSHVAHHPSGSFPTTSSHLDPGLRYGSLENDFDGVTDMKPHD
ncbi:hypothetical protein Tco_0573527 [Tanacetum coccineum]